MERLDIASNTPQSDGRLKALLWPTIRHEGDLDQVAENGFWMCLFVGLFSLVVGVVQRRPFSSLFEFVFFFLAGIGVRQQNRVAGIVAFAAYLGEALVIQRLTGSGFGILTIIILALLLANVRGVWVAFKWGTENELPKFARLNDTFFDKLSGRFPEVRYRPIGLTNRFWPGVASTWAFN